MKIGFLFIFSFLADMALAQVYPKADYIWQMGYGNNEPEYGGTNQIRIDFDFSPPVIDTAHYPFRIHPTYAGICDSAGDILMYTNGFALANREHQIMENGDTLMVDAQAFASFGLPELPAGALILPNPLNNGIYYLFHEEIQLGYNWVFNNPTYRVQRIYLTTIDMNANGGLGKVIEKNKVITYDPLLLDDGKILAVRHANGRDWWVTVPRFNSNKIIRFLVTPSGIQFQPDALLDMPQYPGNQGQASFSPDGKLYASITLKNQPGMPPQQYLYVMHFDRCAGNFYNQIRIPVEDFTYGVFFSPDSRYMYLAHDDGMKLTQYDVTVPDWNLTGILVQEWDGTNSPFPTVFGYGCPAPDGKAYFVGGNGVNRIHIIHQPNKRGAACQVQQNVKLPAINFVTIPNFPNFRLGPMDGTECDSLGLDNIPVAHWRYERDTLNPLTVYFTDLSYLEPATWNWDFGDGSPMSQDTSPVHTFPGPGVYEVCLTVSNGNGSGTQCRALEFTVGTQAAEPSGTVQVRPNPFHDYLEVVTDLDHAVFSIYDALGRLVKTTRLSEGRNTIPTELLPPGLYAWELRDARGRQVKTGKAIKR